MIDYAHALNEAQYTAVTIGDGPVLIIAGAGSGKTRTIVYRLAWLVEHGLEPDAMLLLTFTRKAAHEMLHRAGILLQQGLVGIQGGTFHSFAFSTLRRWKPAWLGERPFTLMDAADIVAAVKHCRDTLKLGKGDRSFPKTQSIVGLLSKSRNKELPLDELLRREAYHLLPHATALAQLQMAYADYRRDKGLLDYDDLLFELEALLRTNAAAMAAIRQRYKHVLVDEYQDTNLVQARIVRLLAGADEGQPGNVMVVGDEAQSIYAFRGANVRNILDFPSLFPGCAIIHLEENYRSTKAVLDVANCLLAHAAESFHKRLFTRQQGGAAVRLITAHSDMSQAQLVTQRIRELLDEYQPQEIAVLFRAGFHSYHVELALQQAGIPFRKYGGLRYSEAAHIKDVMAYVRLILNPLDLPAFARLAVQHSGIGPKTVERLYAAAQTGDAALKVFAKFPGFLDDMRFIDELRAKGCDPAATLDAVLERYRPRLEALYPEDWPRRQQGLDEIAHMASAYADLDFFVADLALETPEDDAPTAEEARITLSTVHSAKGLEWNAVLIIDLVEDRFPSRHALARPENFEEERRLMYVACTRARQRLELYVPSSLYNRAAQGNEHVCASPFVRELTSDIVEEWEEGPDGILFKRDDRSRASTREQGDCQLPEDEVDSEPLAPGGQGGTEERNEARAGLGYCRHRIFGRGKIVRQLPPDKVQVHFPGFGLKVILSEYLLLE
ncbi:MAG: ATP-dependent helicase [Desulfovibrio sp.]|nr:ATP-dependent helicase [Desulfovibrio sp.]